MSRQHAPQRDHLGRSTLANVFISPSTDMLFILCHAVAVSAGLQTSLSGLIVSARMQRGYQFEDRATRVKHLDTAIDWIPQLGRDVKHVMKETMMASYDVASVMRRVRMSLADLRAFNIQGRSAGSALLKKLNALLDISSRAIKKIVSSVIATCKTLPNWNDQIQGRVNAQVAELSRWLKSMTSSISLFGKYMTSTNLNDAKEALRIDPTDDLLQLLAENIFPLVANARDSLSPADRYEYNARMSAISDHTHTHLFLVWRIDERLFVDMLLALHNPVWRRKGDKLRKALVLSEASSVTENHCKFHCLPKLQFSLGGHPFPGDRQAFANILRKQEQGSRDTAAVAEVTEAIRGVANDILANRFHPGQERMLQDLRESLTTLGRAQERGFDELSRMRYEYACSGHSYYKSRM